MTSKEADRVQQVKGERSRAVMALLFFPGLSHPSPTFFPHIVKIAIWYQEDMMQGLQ